MLNRARQGLLRHAVAVQRRAFSSKLYGAAVIERRPDIWMEPEPWEKKYHLYAETRLRRKERGDFPASYDEAADLEHLPNYKPANKHTAADMSGDHGDIKRQLFYKLYLIGKNKTSNVWEFPSTELVKNNTSSNPGTYAYSPKDVRTAAQLSIGDAFGPGLTVWFPGPAPIGVLEQANSDKTFMMWCQYIDGDVDLGSRYSEHAWVTKKELLSDAYLGPQQDQKALFKDILVEITN
jgi:hypothetical protein